MRAWIAAAPKRALVIGKAVFLLGAILIVGAMFARVGLVAINSQRALAKLPALRTVAEAYPQYPTWMVPEGPVGYGVAAVLVLVGMALVVLAEKAAKQERSKSGKWW